MPIANETLSRPGEYASRAATDDMAKMMLEEASAAAEPAGPAKAPPSSDPIELWRSGLKTAGITEDQAGIILDSMLDKGYWERDYRLFNGRVVLRLRTRDAANINRIMAMIDRIRVPTQVMIDEHIAQLNLAGSIVTLRDATLPHPNVNTATVDAIEDAFDKRREFVSRIPGPLMPSVRAALIHFDSVVGAALANGAAEGF